MDNYLLGEWKLVSARATNLEGQWVDEPVQAGTGVYLPNGRVVVFFKTTEVALGYTGRYEYRDGTLTTRIEASNVAALDHATLVRQVEVQSPKRYRMLTVDEVTNIRIEAVWERQA